MIPDCVASIRASAYSSAIAAAEKTAQSDAAATTYLPFPTLISSAPSSLLSYALMNHKPASAVNVIVVFRLLVATILVWMIPLATLGGAPALEEQAHARRGHAGAMSGGSDDAAGKERWFMGRVEGARRALRFRALHPQPRRSSDSGRGARGHCRNHRLGTADAEANSRASRSTSTR